MKPPAFFRFSGGFFRVEDNRRVEEAEEDDAEAIEQQIDRLTMREILVQRDHEIAHRAFAGDRVAAQLA